VLVRHGRSAHVHAGWVDIHGFRRWREAYEAASLSAGEQPPAALVALGGSADLVVASDAPRAVASAERLVAKGPVQTSPLLRELDLDAPSLGQVRLPLLAWAVAVGARSFLLARRASYRAGAEAKRVTAAAAWLDELSAGHLTTVVVTHASLRRRLWGELQNLGWQSASTERSWENWSAWSLRQSTRFGPCPPA
jgi:broad specificity phosphatase PhoE